MSFVALELWDMIIDHLWDHPGALASCSLVCRAWLPSTRLHLFRQVELPLDFPSITIKFSELLKNPSIASVSIAHCVRELRVCRTACNDWWHRATRTLRPMSKQKPENYTALVDDLFSRLTRVRFLSLHFMSSVLDEEMAKSIVTYFSAISVLCITAVKFSSLDQFHYFTHAFPSLSSLNLNSVCCKIGTTNRDDTFPTYKHLPSDTTFEPSAPDLRRDDGNETDKLLWSILFDIQTETLFIDLTIIIRMRSLPPAMSAGDSISRLVEITPLT